MKRTKSNPSSRRLAWIAPALGLCFALPMTGFAQTSAPGELASAATPENYRLSANDLIYVKVFEEDDLNSTLRVTEDGSIIFPLIGVVKVGGLSVQAATRTIRDQLNARFLVNPQVTLTVLGYANRNVTVLGQVQRPGTFSMKDQGSIDLLRAIGLAGGFTRLANSAKVTVKRTVSGREVVTTLDAKRMAGDSTTPPFALLPGDTVTVAERLF